MTPEEIAAVDLALIAPDSLQQETAEGLTLESTLCAEEPSVSLVERIALRDAIDALPEKERKTILLRFFKGLTQGADRPHLTGIAGPGLAAGAPQPAKAAGPAGRGVTSGRDGVKRGRLDSSAISNVKWIRTEGLYCGTLIPLSAGWAFPRNGKVKRFPGICLSAVRSGGTRQLRRGALLFSYSKGKNSVMVPRYRFGINVFWHRGFSRSRMATLWKNCFHSERKYNSSSPGRTGWKFSICVMRDLPLAYNSSSRWVRS